MALIPSGRQLYLDSFHCSLSKFHGFPLHFFRYNSSIPLKTRTFYANSKYPPTDSKQNSNNDVSLSSGDWLSIWNQPNKLNRPKPPQAVVNYRKDNSNSDGGGTTMERIVEKLKKFGYVDGDGKSEKNAQEEVIEKGSVEDIFYVEEGTLPNSRGGFSKESPLGIEDVFKVDGEVRFPWEKSKKKKENEGEEGEEGEWTARRKSRTWLAEMTLPESELRRLRNLTFQIKSKTRIGGAGVTQEVVNAIRDKWKTSEIVRVKVEGAPALNMRRMHEILERKTGGLVIWRSGTAVSLYRGVSYEVPSVKQNKRVFKRNEISTNAVRTTTNKFLRDTSNLSSNSEVPTNKFLGDTSNRTSNSEVPALQSNSETSIELEVKKEIEMPAEVKYEDEVDKLLDGLGPRYTDWPGLDPLPVDADLLPGVVPGHQPPFRVLPFGVKLTLGIKEATSLRRLARFLPPHFALGRSRQLQGLAVAMIKLWEKSSIAKIALKRGVQLTTSERMAEDLKKLTGGMLLSRNKDFLVFYRGKNFLSVDVAEALQERERMAKSLQDDEEQARLRASALAVPSVEKLEGSGTAGTLEETLNADSRWGKKLDDRHKEKMVREVEISRHANLVRKLERKLVLAERKLMRAEKALSKVEKFLQPAERQADPQSITDEERFMFRKLGLRMKAFLLLGRRGVFDGTVENMHLHWKYRELVKIILKARNFEEVKKIALALEAESGGVLVSVDKVSKGYAIVVYRGKDYQRPSTLRPKNLLTKRRALARSIEIQRREALLTHISAMQTRVDKLRSEIEQMANVKDSGAEELYDRLDSAYSSDDYDPENEGDEEYIETYNSDDDGVDYYDDETKTAVPSAHLETNLPDDVQNQDQETEPEECRNEAEMDFYDSESDNKIDDDYNDSRSQVQNLHTNFPY